MLPEEDAPPSTPEWMVTFGDMMSILLTFFIMLVSMSEIRQGTQFKKLADSLRFRFGEQATNRPGDAEVDRDERHRFRHAPTTLPGKETAQPAQPPIRGILRFETGQAELTDEHQRQLQSLAEAVGGGNAPIAVRGCAAQQPDGVRPEARELQSHYADNWYLAYTRCHRTMEFLAGMGVDRRRFRLGVIGEQEPVKIASRPLAWQRNERVEVLMLNERPGAAEFAAEDDVPP